MTTLEEQFAQSYMDEAYGGIVEVFVPGIQGASVTGPQGEKGEPGDKGEKGDRGAAGPQGPQGSSGRNGSDAITFFPSVDSSGNLSWTNDGGADNPMTVNIMGPKGEKGDTGDIAGLDLSIYATKTELADYVPNDKLSTVAFTGSYSDLDDIPDEPVVNKVQQNTEATSTRPVLLARGTTGEHQTWYTNKVKVNAASGDLIATSFNGMDVTKMITEHQDLSAYVKSADLASVATSGAYEDLRGAPSLAAVASSGSYSDLSGVPDLTALSESLTEALLLAAHPVGSLYWSSEATDPSDLFGGTWERIKDRFILAAGDDYAVGATGGEVSHAITKAELPAVSPQIAVSTAGYLPKGAALGAINRIGASKTVGSGTFTDRVVGKAYSEGTPAYEDATTIAPLGDGEAMPIMPPYETYYCWKRTA